MRSAIIIGFVVSTLTSFLIAAAPATQQSVEALQTIIPIEDPDVVLRNPDMGWVLYENYPLDQRDGGSSTLVGIPNEDFPEADVAALMFAWSDVEREEGKYDFTHVDFAYDYWAKRGKAIHLRISTESLLWWNHAAPPSGEGVPGYVLQKLPDAAKQTRLLEGSPYVVVDAREPYYLERLDKFLAAVRAHFGDKRPVTMIDLRGFGVWGEWHSGFKYASDSDRREALKTIIDHWSRALPEHWVSLSYSYDPDGPKALYGGTYRYFDASSNATYDQFLAYSAFDQALTKSNVSFRRDGAGGAVHSNERKLCEAAFVSLAHGPFMSEFCGGYIGTKPGGDAWQRWMIEDALSLHPNYINLLGWQGGDALAFCQEKPEWVAHGLRTMGYRLMPLKVRFAKSIERGRELRVASQWANRGVGRALRPYELHVIFANEREEVIAQISAGALETDRWIRGSNYPATNRAAVPNDLAPGTYTMQLAVVDPKDGKRIALPVRDGADNHVFSVGEIDVK